MQNHIKIIEQLSDAQVAEITILLGEYLQRYEPQYKNTSEEVFHSMRFSEIPTNMRSVLFITASLPDKTGEYLRNQLTQNETYLATQREASQSRGVEFSTLLPYAAMLMAFLKSEINLSIKDGKVDFSMNIKLLSLAELITYFNKKELTAPEATVKNSIVNSTIDANGNVHIGDKYTVNLADAIPPEAQSKIYAAAKLTIQNQIGKNRIKEALDSTHAIIKTHPSIDQEIVIGLKQRWKELKQNEMMGIIRRPEANVERNQIVQQLLKLLGEL